MKLTKLFNSLLWSSIALLSISSCTDYNTFTEADLQHEAKLQEYYDNFVKEFGEPDPNHTWGWEGMTPELADAILGQNATRASYNPGNTNPDEYKHEDPTDNQQGRILVNRNQWAEWDGSLGDYKTYSIARMVHIPGWPNEDNQYIAEDTPVNHDGKYSGMPKGDISEYEIQYVSWYMRNHPFDPQNPTATQLQLVDLHVSEFFIQQVSHDKDYETYTPQGAARDLTYFGGGSDWSMNALKFKALDGNWTHINNFNGNENDAPQSHIGSNNGRVIQYVMSSGTEDFNYHSATSTNSLTFDKWVMVRIEWDEPRNPDWTRYTTPEALATYLQSNKSDTFHRVGYYLCFDFQANKDDNNEEHPGMDYKGDNVYSNWILKITPGKQVQIDRWPKRLMCEDLGNTYDFDFNDAVFDLFFQENTNESGYYDCIVTLQAAGGTMPIWVAINPNDLPAGYSRESAEIHKLLGGYPATTPGNVIKGGAKAPFASYRVKKLFQKSDEAPSYRWNDTEKKWEPNTGYTPTDGLMTLMAAAAFKLSIYIQTPDHGMQTVSGYNIFKTLRDESPAGYNNGVKNTSYIPQLFNCSVDAKWTYENGHIKEAYKHFADWVQAEQGQYRLRWDKDGYYARSEGTGVESVGHFSNTTEWYGSWDFGPKEATSWGSNSEWIDKSKCWGGNGPE